MELKMMIHGPMGRKEECNVNEIDPDDKQWFLDNNVKLSIEVLRTGQKAVYADYGKVVEGEPDEVIDISMNESCQVVMARLRQRTQEAHLLHKLSQK